MLAVDNGVAPEIVDDGVTGFVRDSPQQLVATIAQVDRLDRTACRAAVEERFSTDRMVADHLALYSQLVGQRRGGAASARTTSTAGGAPVT
ncbi:MAG: hypothetical protein QOJ06_218 [Pseudonocardiales bacterium]|nr:hypothetical protein [Pseudonocardiales bacterium]